MWEMQINYKNNDYERCLRERASDPSTRLIGPSGQAGGYAPRFSGFFLALAEFRFDGESTLPPRRIEPVEITAANANRRPYL